MGFNMDILIVGEYSSFSKELKSGFKALGHKCMIFSWGDGCKEIKQTSDDFSIKINYNHGKLIRVLSTCWSNLKLNIYVNKLCKLWKANVVIIVNPTFVRRKFQIWRKALTKKMISKLSYANARIILAACGTDYFYCIGSSDLRLRNKYLLNKFTPKIIKQYKKCMYNVLSIIDIIIPSFYDYAETYRMNISLVGNKLQKTIPIPIDETKFKSENVIHDKIVIFLGKMREEKGYKSMNNAVNYIINKYPDKVIRIPGRWLTIDEYLKEISKANIVLDQCADFSYGMNSLYPMAMGKCVLACCKPECLKEFGVKESPIIDIDDDVDQIVKQLTILVENPSLIIEYGKRCRKYIEDVHDSKIIAEKYIELC